MTAIESLERSLQGLPEDERDQLGRSFVRVIELLEARTEALSADERRASFQQLHMALEWLIQIRFAGEPGHGAAIPDRQALEPSLAELEKLNTANRFAQWHQAMRESFSTAELEANGLSRQQLEQWRKLHKLIALKPPFGRGFIYPAWEFNQDARPLDLIPALAQAAREAHLDPLSLHRLMVSDTATPEGPLTKALRAGDDDYVLNVVRAAGAQGG
jgi:hypothetical protein